jgi:ABC-2 type transport system permease protein
MKDQTNYNRMTGARVFAAYVGEMKWEFVKMIRNPMFAVPTLFFPVMFYLLFAVLLYKGNAQGVVQILSRMGVFGVMAPGLFGFGVALAFEREYGLLQFKQALPMPPGSYLLARMAMAMMFAAIIALSLISLALFVSHAPLTVSMVAKLFVTEILGVLPFCAMGLTVGTLVSGQAAPAVINVIYLPMAFLSGTFFPLEAAGPFLSGMGPIWPSFHLTQLALDAVGQPHLGTAWSHVAALLGFTILFFSIALTRLSSGGIRMFGPSRQATPGFPVGRALRAGLFWAAVALVVTGFMNGRAKVVAAPSVSAEASGSAATDPAASHGPVGVAAPRDPLIADFDAGADQARYGAGWFAAGDKDRGGNSTATQRVITGGAAGSPGALEVTGTIGDGMQYPFAGTAFFPNGTAEGKLTDYRGRKELRFFARGDGRQYLVVFLGSTQDGIPPMYGFTTAPDWQEVVIPLGDVIGLDLAAVHGMVIGSNGPLGDFHFELDGIELR